MTQGKANFSLPWFILPVSSDGAWQKLLNIFLKINSKAPRESPGQEEDKCLQDVSFIVLSPEQNSGLLQQISEKNELLHPALLLFVKCWIGLNPAWKI